LTPCPRGPSGAAPAARCPPRARAAGRAVQRWARTSRTGRASCCQQSTPCLRAHRGTVERRTIAGRLLRRTACAEKRPCALLAWRGHAVGTGGGVQARAAAELARFRARRAPGRSMSRRPRTPRDTRAGCTCALRFKHPVLRPEATSGSILNTLCRQCPLRECRPRSTAERGARTPRLAPERVGVGPVVVFPEALPAVVPVQPDIVVQPNRSPPCRVVRSGHSVIRLDAQGHEQKLSSLSLDSSLVSSITAGFGHTAWRVQLSLTCVDCAAEARGRPSSSGGRAVVNVLARPDSQRDAAAS